VRSALAWLQRNIGNSEGFALDELAADVQARMSDHAGFVCHAEEVPGALEASRTLNREIAARGVNIDEPRRLSEGVLRVQTALLSEAVLAALDHYIRDSGGSRGARMLCAANGTSTPSSRLGDLDQYRFLTESPAHRQEKILLRYRPETGMEIFKRPLRPIEDTGKIYFEKNWGAYLTGAIYPADE
jgi:hypothetical protein